MNKPFFSVVIPTYNSEKYIEQALLSVLNQKFNDYEIIIIDDGSIDATLKIIEKYKDVKIRVISQSNNGPAKARNVGILNAIGDYICFLDSDDLWKPNKLTEQLNVLKSDLDVKLVFSSAEAIDEEGNYLYRHLHKVGNNHTFFLKMLFLGKITMITSSLVIHRETLLKEKFFFDEGLRHREDHLFIMNFVNKYKYKYLLAPLTKRRLRSGSLSSDNIDLKLKYNKYFHDICLSLFKFPLAYSNSFWSEMYYTIALDKVKSSDRRSALLFCFKSIRYDFTMIKSYITVILAILPIKYNVFESFLLSIRKIRNKK